MTRFRELASDCNAVYNVLSLNEDELQDCSSAAFVLKKLTSCSSPEQKWSHDEHINRICAW